MARLDAAQRPPGSLPGRSHAPAAPALVGLSNVERMAGALSSPGARLQLPGADVVDVDALLAAALAATAAPTPSPAAIAAAATPAMLGLSAGADGGLGCGRTARNSVPRQLPRCSEPLRQS